MDQPVFGDQPEADQDLAELLARSLLLAERLIDLRLCDQAVGDEQIAEAPADRRLARATGGDQRAADLAFLGLAPSLQQFCDFLPSSGFHHSWLDPHSAIQMPAPGVSRIVEKQEFSSGFGWPLAPRGGQFRCRVASFLSARLHAVALALDGIVVADLTQNVAGPFCTQILGDMGAEVVKVERPARGDDARAWAPPYWGDESATFMAMNRNKKSLALDLKGDGGLEVLRRLIARADVFVQSLRAGALGELGLDFAGAARINPRLVYCSITAFGARGPLADLDRKSTRLNSSHTVISYAVFCLKKKKKKKQTKH